MTPLPEETASAARSVFNQGNVYLHIGDRYDDLFADLNLAQLDPTSEKSMTALTMHAVVTLFQFAEALPDRQAAEATRTRIDWKYALHLPFVHPGIKPDSLCRFRQRLWPNPAGWAVFEQMTERTTALGLFSKQGKPARKAAAVLQSVCSANRLDQLAQAFGQALEALAGSQPEWLRAIALPHWYLRYDHLNLNARAPNSPIERNARAEALGSDSHHLLEACRRQDDHMIRSIAEIQTLCRVFEDQFYVEQERGQKQVKFFWRPEKCASCGSVRCDPYRSVKPRR